MGFEEPWMQMGQTVVRGCFDQDDILFFHKLWLQLGEEGFRTSLESNGLEWMTVEQFEDLQASTEMAWKQQLKGE